jgi:hypothetical protein
MWRRLTRVVLVLCCAFDRRNPDLAASHPDLSLRLQVERRVVERADPNLYEAVAGICEVQ